MLTLVIGKPNSGKSLVAEELAVSTEGKEKYYLATMAVIDEEGERRVLRHRAQREGKGFITLEIPRNLKLALDRIPDPEESVVLLECVSNLVGNEMRAVLNSVELSEGIKKPVTGKEKMECTADQENYMLSFYTEPFRKEVCQAVLEEIEQLAGEVRHLILVTTEYEISDEYDEETRTYIGLIDTVNEHLTGFADKTVRV